MADFNLSPEAKALLLELPPTWTVSVRLLPEWEQAANELITAGLALVEVASCPDGEVFAIRLTPHGATEARCLRIAERTGA